MTNGLVFAGSARAESFNGKLAQVAAVCAEAQGAQVTLHNLSWISVARIPDAFARIRDALFGGATC